jgi:hypothetical protein
MLFQQIRNRLSLVKFRFCQGRSAVEIGGVDIGAVRNQ